MAVKAAQRYFGPSRFVTRGSESTPYELLIDQEHERPHRRSMFRKTGVRVGLVLVLLVMVVFCALSPLLFSRHTLPEKRPVLVASASILGNFSSWAVATDASLCAPVARKVQARGGTIADVAVATLLCMGVVLPHSMGMGGGFLATVYTRKTRKAQTLIAREKAPEAATKDMFVSNPKLAQTGGLSVAVPGELRGYRALLDRMGSNVSWEALFEDAIRLARHGFAVHPHLANALQVKKYAVYSHENMRKIFWNAAANDTLREGDLVVQPDLAATLELVAKHGPDYFYEGAFAAQLVREVKANGGNMTLEDLASYQAEWQVPVNVSFKDDLTLYSVPPPGSGPVLGYIMGIMDAFRTDAKETLADDVLTLHRFLEACKFAYAQRALLGDPKFVELGQLVGNLTSVEQALATRRLIDDARTFDEAVHYLGEEPFQPDHGTAHASFLGPDGDAVAVTSTVNFYFGSVVRSGGVMLNNEMDDFSVPGTSNLYGVAPSEANYAAPGKRPMSSMAPAVVVGRDGDVQLVLGGAGGAKITSGIALVSMRYLWQGNNIKEAIDFPRVHHQLLPNQVDVEANFPQVYRRLLEKKGHKVVVPKGRFSIMMGIGRREGRVYANADFRKGGSVDGD